MVHVVVGLQHHRQSAVVAGFWGSDHAIYYFFLQHEVLVNHPVGYFKQSKQDGRGNIVGQVAHHAKRRGELPEVKFQHIHFVNRELVFPATGSKFLCQVPINFNHLQVIHCLE